MKKLTSLPLFVFLLLSCSSDPKIAMEQKLETYFKGGTIPAAIMGSTDEQGNTSYFIYGPAVWGEQKTLTPDNIFRIYSMTKAIASVGAMQLVEQGRIGLDDTLNTLMPEMAKIPILEDDGKLTPTDQPITLRQLLTHTSGFGYDFMNAKLANFKPEKWEYSDKPRLFQPGTAWHYGTSTDWVGKVIEKVSGKDLETYLRENVTGPLKMNSTWFNVPDSLTDMIVSWGQRDSTGKIVEIPRLPKEKATVYSAGGGLFSSPNDYLRFLQCLLNYGELDGARVLKKETVELMLKDHLPAQVLIPMNNPDSLAGSAFLDKADRWGLAWAVEGNSNDPARPQGVVFWAGAANTYFTLDFKNKIGVAYFTQFFPYNDKESYNFYRLFEKEVYLSKGATK